MTDTIPTPEPLPDDWTPDFDATDVVETLIFEALGAASSCWENLNGAGVFRDGRAKAIGEEVLRRLRLLGVDRDTPLTDTTPDSQFGVYDPDNDAWRLITSVPVPQDSILTLTLPQRSAPVLYEQFSETFAGMLENPALDARLLGIAILTDGQTLDVLSSEQLADLRLKRIDP